MFGIVRTLVNIVFGIIEFLLSLRFIFKFFAVNSSTPFVTWIYSVTASLVSPFARILPDGKISVFVIDFTTLAALVAYAIAGWLILMIVPHSGRRTDV